MNQSAQFWNKIAEKYARDPVSNEKAYQHKLEKTRELFTPESTVLEIACGTGLTAVTHAPHVKSIYAVDFSKEMIRIAKGKAEAAGIANIKFEVGAIEDLPKPDALYDLVMAHSIIHLLEDKLQVINKVQQMLKPGGHFVSSTACLGDMNPLIPLALPFMRMIGKAPYVDVFTEEELANSINSAGFDITYQWKPKKGSAVFIIVRKPA